MRIYLDNAATTPLSPGVKQTMMEIMEDTFGNPSSIHAEGRKARTIIERARRTIADHLKASIGEIFFTSCGTESNNMVLKGAVRDLGVTRIISSPIEHHCILHSLDAIQKEHPEVSVHLLNINESGQIDYDQLEQLLQSSEQKTLVSLMHANNEIGTLLDLDKVAAICEEYDALFHTDTVQTIGYYPIDVSTTKIHFLSGSGHKLHGPKGVGFVYVNGDYIIKPYIDGGSQERNMRAGTENLYGIAGFAKAMEEAQHNLEERSAYIQELKSYMCNRLFSEIDGLQLISPEDNCHYKILSVSFPPSSKSDLLVLSLDIAGISASGGSACSSGAEKGSHVLEGIKADQDRKAIRFSFSHFNTKEEIDQVVEKIKQLSL